MIKSDSIARHALLWGAGCPLWVMALHPSCPHSPFCPPHLGPVFCSNNEQTWIHWLQKTSQCSSNHLKTPCLRGDPPNHVSLNISLLSPSNASSDIASFRKTLAISLLSGEVARHSADHAILMSYQDLWRERQRHRVTFYILPIAQS